MAETRPVAPRRSLLFVPGVDARKIERAREAGADTVILDLEDSVPPERKPEARRIVAEAIRAGATGPAELAVRVNGSDTPHFADDLEAVMAAGAGLIVLPKAETPSQLACATHRIATLERAQPDRGWESVRMLLLIETPAGLIHAADLARASARVDGLCFGHADFSAAMGLGAADASQGVLLHARCSLVIAAKACGIAALDCVPLAVKDLDACRADATLGLGLGYDGKMCIHPDQVAVVNEVYRPSAAQVAAARRVLEAAEAARARGQGAAVLDGKMIDEPVVAAQRRVLERAGVS